MKTLEEAELCFPHLNSSCRKPMRPHSLSMLTYILLSSISLLTVILNLLVIISISHFRQLHTPTNLLLLLSLAVSDFFVGFLMFFHMVLIDGCWLFGDLMCALYNVLIYINTSASIGTMVLISVDRYVAICEPLHYANKVTQKRVQVCNCLCWTCSAFLHSLLLKENLEQPGRYNSCLGECIIVVNYIAGIADLFFSFIGPVTVIIVLYMRVFVVAVTQARAMRSHIVALPLKRSVTVTAKRSELKAARNLGVVIVVFLLCICPFFSAILTGQDTLLNASTAVFVTCIFYFNSLLNPVIYAFFYPWFRKSMKFIVTLKILQPGSYMTNIM
ncbi:trace amine-associated receptor 13c-like [Pseudoliparis swirei]|uniref:trace amine-associated receptor 13c-like n=1 Tax=Pseudoliparis swirei TaxID=2059687 RepID=UPI0024BDC4DC|nr:trace amine-associated receptor 13c-like [Pseudoliparis swirei]